MERLKGKIAGASKALAMLREVTGIDEVPAITRDAAIQRFEFTFEAIWKVAKIICRNLKGLRIPNSHTTAAPLLGFPPSQLHSLRL